MQYRSARARSEAVANAFAARREASREPRCVSRSSPGRGRMVAALRGSTRQRGIPGPSSPCHGHRSARRPERRDRSVARRDEGRSVPPTSCASWSTCRRRASSSPRAATRRSSVRRSSPFGRRSRPAVSSARSTSWSSIRDHDADAITEALVEECLRSASNKGCTVVEAARPATRRTWRALGAAWVSARPAATRNDPWPRPDVPCARRPMTDPSDRAACIAPAGRRSAHTKESTWARTSPSS